MTTNKKKTKRSKFHTVLMGEPISAKTQIGYPRKEYAVMYDHTNKSLFSKQKLKYGTFQSNPKLKKFPKIKTGKIKMKNGSVIYFKTDSGKYKHVTGKSLRKLKFSPNQEVQILIDSALVAIQVAKLHLSKNDPYSSALLRVKRAIKYVNKAERILNGQKK